MNDFFTSLSMQMSAGAGSVKETCADLDLTATGDGRRAVMRD